MVDPSLLADAPDRLLALAADLLLWGDTARGGEYLDLLERAQPPIPPESRLAARFAAMRSLRYALTGQVDRGRAQALAARAIQERTQLTDEWDAAVPLVLLRAYTWLEDFEAVEREAAAALAMPGSPSRSSWCWCPGRRRWPGSRPATWPRPPRPPGPPSARRSGWDSTSISSPWITCVRWPASRWSGGTSTPRSSSPSRRCRYPSARRPAFEFLALLDRAEIWAARGQVRDALATVEAARLVLAGTEIGAAGAGR